MRRCARSAGRLALLAFALAACNRPARFRAECESLAPGTPVAAADARLRAAGAGDPEPILDGSLYTVTRPLSSTVDTCEVETRAGAVVAARHREATRAR